MSQLLKIRIDLEIVGVSKQTAGASVLSNRVMVASLDDIDFQRAVLGVMNTMLPKYLPNDKAKLVRMKNRRYMAEALREKIYGIERPEISPVH